MANILLRGFNEQGLYNIVALAENIRGVHRNHLPMMRIIMKNRY
jgi:hypothetical protein